MTLYSLKVLWCKGYERYLEANGRPTRIAVSSVLESSPALLAGIQVGDEIINYDGQRVFSVADLTRQTMQGDASDSALAIPSQPMQYVVIATAWH